VLPFLVRRPPCRVKFAAGGQTFESVSSTSSRKQIGEVFRISLEALQWRWTCLRRRYLERAVHLDRSMYILLFSIFFPSLTLHHIPILHLHLFCHRHHESTIMAPPKKPQKLAAKSAKSFKSAPKNAPVVSGPNSATNHWPLQKYAFCMPNPDESESWYES
jgi:hypothetical protein